MIAELIAPIETPDTPVRLHASFMHGLIYAGLVGAKRSAAVKHERDAIAALRPPGAIL
jgi:hypothetical protein